MTRVLLDTNVILDVLLTRQPHFAGSRAVWILIETGKWKGFLAAHAVTTIHYLIRKETGETDARRSIAAMLRVCAVAPVDEQVLRDALLLGFADFEDGVTAAAAARSGCDYIVTRDPKGFRKAEITVGTPEAILALLP